MNSEPSNKAYSIVNVASLAESYLQEMKLKGEKPELSISTLPALNKMLWGLRKRRLTIIAARPSQGKSAFAIQLALDLAMQNKKVLFLSLEMENLECFERIITSANEISNFALRKTSDGMQYEQRIKKTAETLKTKKFIISDCLGKTWEDIDAIITESGMKFDAVFLDYIQNTKTTAKTQKEGYDEYIRHFRELAIRHNFAAVLLSQINRASQETKDRRPNLHQLKGSGGLEEMCDAALLLFWEYKYDENVDINHYEVIVAKNKMGVTGYTNIRFYPQFSLFKELISDANRSTDKVVAGEGKQVREHDKESDIRSQDVRWGSDCDSDLDGENIWGE